MSKMGFLKVSPVANSFRIISHTEFFEGKYYLYWNPSPIGLEINTFPTLWTL